MGPGNEVGQEQDKNNRWPCIIPGLIMCFAWQYDALLGFDTRAQEVQQSLIKTVLLSREKQLIQGKNKWISLPNFPSNVYILSFYAFRS